MNFINKQVEKEGSVDGKNKIFHPDSTLEAWEHYHKIYFNEKTAKEIETLLNDAKSCVF